MTTKHDVHTTTSVHRKYAYSSARACVCVCEGESGAECENIYTGVLACVYTTQPAASLENEKKRKGTRKEKTISPCSACTGNRWIPMVRPCRVIRWKGRRRKVYIVLVLFPHTLFLSFSLSLSLSPVFLSTPPGIFFRHADWKPRRHHYTVIYVYRKHIHTRTHLRVLQ